MSDISSNPAYSGALSILSSSADAMTNASDKTESANQQLIDIAKKATSGTSATSNPQDTVDLSDDALSYLSSQKSGRSSATSPNDAETQHFLSAWNQAFAGFDPKAALDQQVASMGDATLQAAYKSGNYKLVNTNDIQGLNFQNHGASPMQNTGFVYSTDNAAVQSQFEAANPDALNFNLPGYGTWYMVPTN